MPLFTMRNAVLLCMGLAIVFAAFAPVTPDTFAPYVKAAAGAATGLAALLMHPPTLTSDPAPTMVVAPPRAIPAPPALVTPPPPAA